MTKTQSFTASGFAAGVLVCTLLACSAADTRAPTPADEPRADTTVPTTRVPPPTPAASPDPVDADSCVGKCIESRQMQAISAQAIETRCREDCAAGSFTP